MFSFLKNIPLRYRYKNWFLPCIAIILISMITSVPAWGVDDPQILAPLYKDAPLGFGRMLQPNVLLLLDTSGSMTFRTDSSTTTWGDGTRPYNGQFYFGEDFDSSNNDVNVNYNYHPNLTYIPTDELPSSWWSWLGGPEPDDPDPPTGYSVYKYPNDSRLYKLKLVLWEILNDPTMISGLNLGMATYYQYKEWIASDWYWWSSYEPISWNYEIDGNLQSRGTLRVPFETTDSADHVLDLMEWIDGYESSTNEELRANGHTPLAYSIYDSDSDFDSAKDFFFDENNGAITNWCQDNWVIVLTDGQETGGGDPIQAVKDLYDHADTSGWEDDFGEPAQPVKTMVIGLLSPEDATASLISDLDDMADYGDDGALNGSASAYLANNVESLLEAFRNAFRTIQVRSGTGGAPLVSPARLEGQSTSVYVSSFIPKQEKQWQGNLSKYTLSGDVMLETPDWNAGETLNLTPYTSRHVYTVDWESNYALKPMVGSNFAIFKDTQADKLRSEIFWNPDLTNLSDSKNLPTVNDTMLFMNWILGSDVYDEEITAERWKLGDIYHSGITEVGEPLGSNPHSSYREFKVNNRDRDKIVYVQANDGMLHAFNVNDTDGNDGGMERWAFIPPNVLSCGRLMGLRGYFESYKQGWRFMQRENDEPTSIPRYLLDGPVVAEDVYINGQWRTVLMCLLGYAGAGMYVIDITDPDKPDFLWALDNSVFQPTGDKVFSQSKNKCISYWVESGDVVIRQDYRYDSTIPTDLDYSALRFTLSVPAMGSMRYNGNDYSVAVMGNGSPRHFEPLQDGAVYIIDMETGKLIDTLTMTNMKQIVTPVTVFRTNNAQRIEKFFVGDNNGQIFMWQIGDNWTGTELMDLQAAVGSSYRMDIARIEGYDWLFVITGDYDPLVSGSANNYFVAINMDYDSSYPLSRSDLTQLVESSDVSASAQGWYMEFQKQDEELATTPPLVYNGYIFFSTFKNDPDPCKVGTSRLYVVNATTGASGWGSGIERYVELEGYRISGITLSSGKVFLGITDYSGGTSTELPSELTALGAGLNGNVLIFDMPDPVADSPFPIASGQMLPRYWREWKPVQ